MTRKYSINALRRIRRLDALAVLLCCATPGLAPAAGQQESPPPPPPPPSLEQLASQASLVAVAQVRDTDYVYAREFPTGGTAYLGVLIAYKLTRPEEDIVEVYEEGLHEHECYFDNPTVFEEGRRHLVFLRDNPEVEGQYLGLPPGCALELLVTDDNRYALLYPPKGMPIADDLGALARPLAFRDAYATVSNEDLSVDERDALLASGMLVELDDGRFRYTHGIPISEIRPLLGPENLTLQRELRRQP